MTTCDFVILITLIVFDFLITLCIHIDPITETNKDKQPKTESGDNIVRNISNKLQHGFGIYKQARAVFTSNYPLSVVTT